MIHLFLVDETCPFCRKACLDHFGEHAKYCRALSGFKYRHELARDFLFDILGRVRVSTKKQAYVNFLTNPLEGRSILTSVDVLVFGWVEGNTHVWIIKGFPSCRCVV